MIFTPDNFKNGNDHKFQLTKRQKNAVANLKYSVSFVKNY